MGVRASWDRAGGGPRKEGFWEGFSPPSPSSWSLFPGKKHVTLTLSSGKGLDTVLPRNLGLMMG